MVTWSDELGLMTWMNIQLQCSIATMLYSYNALQLQCSTELQNLCDTDIVDKAKASFKLYITTKFSLRYFG